MTKAERLTGREVCSSPEELASLFNQWKLSPEGQFEPLRDLAFGFYLAQQVFPNSQKYPYPAFKIDQSKRVASVGVQSTITDGPIHVLVSKSWLQEHLKDNHPSTYLITIGVEEFSHWVFEHAIKQRRSKEYRASLINYYELTKENLERQLKENSVKLKKIGFFGPQIDKIEALIESGTSAILKHACTLQEYMGLVWRNQVSQRYYPWSEEATEAKEQLEEVLAYKRQEAAEKRIAALKQMS